MLHSSCQSLAISAAGALGPHCFSFVSFDALASARRLCCWKGDGHVQARKTWVQLGAWKREQCKSTTFRLGGGGRIMGQTGTGVVPVLKASGSRKLKLNDTVPELAVPALSISETESLHINTQFDSTRGHFRSSR